MKAQEILQKAIEKSVKNGYKLLGDDNCLELCQFKITEELDVIVWEREYLDEGVSTFSYQEIIFSHDFAKAFFGDKKLREIYFDNHWKANKKDNYTITKCTVYAMRPAWRLHLQHMVIQENPIAYLEAYL